MVKKYFKTSKKRNYSQYVRSNTRRPTISRGLKRKIEEDAEMPSSSRQKLGHYTSIDPSKTTLARSLGPFTGKKFVELIYWQTPLLQTTTAGGSFLEVRPNSAFDYDVTGNLGNKQPMYYDSLMTASGPYKSYKVVSWKTTWTFVNASTVGVNIWVSPPVLTSSECDSVAEAEEFPGVKKITLTSESGSKGIATCTITGSYKDVYPAAIGTDAQFAAYNANPAGAIAATIVYQPADASSVTKLYVGVKHVMNCILGQVDNVVS